MTVAFIRNGNALLPEIEAYISFFNKYPDVKTEVVTPENRTDRFYELEWHFMGTHLKRSKNALIVHEYASTSVPPFSRLKNTFKRRLNCTPDYRIFYDEFVRDQLGFNDQIAYGFRGHGVYPSSVVPSAFEEKRFDFVYVGSTDKIRKLDHLWDCFAGGALKDRSLLVLSKNYEQLRGELSAFPNIHFAGPVPYREVYGYIKQCRYGINLIPDVYPFNHQVSAKFLDYAACGIPIISSKYFWIQKFERQYGGSYFYLKEDLSNLKWDNINSFNFKSPDLSEWTWEKQIERSGIQGFLHEKFPDIFQ